MDGRRLAPSRRFPAMDQTLFPFLLWEISRRFREHLPEEYREAVESAKGNGYRVINGPVSPDPDLAGLALENPIFSTITINHNVSFRSHEDGGNSALSTLVTFGEFKGGYLCLPRLRVAFDVRPGDLLIANTAREQHGSILPRSGERYSMVAYLRS